MSTNHAAALPALAAAQAPASAPNRFFEALSFEGLGVTIGVRFVIGVGYRVVMKTPQEERHMSASRTRRLARDIEDTPSLAEVAAGLKATADQLDPISVPSEGWA